LHQQIDLKGDSGASYRYKLAEGDEPRTALAGNYVYVKEAKGGAQVICAGETNNLSTGARDRWNEAQAQGATHLFFRLNVGGAIRAQELDDLVRSLHPPMNESPPAFT